MKKKSTKKKAPIHPWGSSLDKMREWDPKGAELLLRVGTNPWRAGVLPLKEVELISLALHCACTNLNEAGTRRHIRAALDAGATRDELSSYSNVAPLWPSIRAASALPFSSGR
jgi:alkylhydroperoxidase/carboxymuconolactone decarboxylase family protein YurZ